MYYSVGKFQIQYSNFVLPPSDTIRKMHCPECEKRWAHKMMKTLNE